MAELLESTLAKTLGAIQIDDDFMHVWPQLVRTALWLDDVALAERLMTPVNDSDRRAHLRSGGCAQAEPARPGRRGA